MIETVTVREFAEKKGVSASVMTNMIARKKTIIKKVSSWGVARYFLSELEEWYSSIRSESIEKASAYHRGKQDASEGKSKVYCSEKNKILESFWLAGWHDWHIENKTGVYQ